MRCPSCNKFVPYEDPHEVELEGDLEVDLIAAEVRADVRVILKCGECGEELKDANISATQDIPGYVPEDHEGDEHDLSVNGNGSDLEPATKSEGKGRGTKMFYGFSLDYKVSCSCGATFEGTLSDFEQASAMNELA